MIPIAEDFDDIRIRLEQIEREKAKVLTTPLPDVQPSYAWAPAAGYLADYDPA